MLIDEHYLARPHRLAELDHKYGANVHLLSSPYLFSTLARLAMPETTQPLLGHLLRILYDGLLAAAVNEEFPQVDEELTSRMHTLHPEGRFRAKIVDRATRAVSVNLARAGTVPSQICYEALNYLLNPEGVRQDHISINRKVNDKEEVVGTSLGGLKIGGDITDRIVLIPDPMGATGSTIKTALDIYKKHGRPKKFVALHLVVTPEYLWALKSEVPQLSIYALRLDRGLSSEKVLKTIPGTHWADEKGLNSKQYIVPGAGGLGEVINNAYV